MRLLAWPLVHPLLLAASIATSHLALLTVPATGSPYTVGLLL